MPARLISAQPDLTPELLLSAYAQGYFPMARGRRSKRIDWYSPEPRAILPLVNAHVPRRVARVVRSNAFSLVFDSSFDSVMRECAADRPDEPGTWINDELIRAYTELFELGFAHSVEAWLGETLVGGLYGVTLRGAFFGESMFHRPALGGSGASKACLAHLIGHLRACGFVLLDVQMVTPATAQFGVVEIARDDYLELLGEAMKVETTWRTL
jgi:leucyl/phenylalanyl-tRNA--protein transferase